MMFRCMTEAENKKIGFVVDLDINRSINNIIIPCNSAFWLDYCCINLI